MAVQKAFTRRRFVPAILTLAVLASVPAGSEMATATESEPATASSNVTTPTQPRGDSNFDGEVTIALTEDIPQIDPHLFSQGIATFNVVEALVDFDAQTGELLPRLATSWELVDPTTWRFTLREGVSFTNGEPFNAEAAAWAIRRVLNPDNELIEGLRSVLTLQDLTATAIDEYTLELTTSAPAPSLPREIYLIRMAAPVATGVEPTNTLIGTGPYVVDDFLPSERLVLTRNEDYWGEKPEVEKATFVFRPESGVRRAMIDTGEADLAPLNPIDVEGIESVQTVRSTVLIMLPDLVCPVTRDIRIREAINLAIDRAGLAEELYGGMVQPASQIIIPQVPGHADNLEPYPYDPDAARALVEEAGDDGVPVETTLRLITRPGHFLNSDELSELVVAQLNEVGLNAMVEVHEILEYGPLIREQNIAPDRCMVFLVTPTNRWLDPATSIRSYYHGGAALGRLEDPEVDAMIDEASAIFDEDERSAAFAELIEHIATTHIPDMPLLYWGEIFGLGPDITYQPRINDVIDLTLIHSR